MKSIILSLFITVLSFAQVDSMRVTWTQAIALDLYGTIIYADSMVTPPTTARDTILAGTEIFDWRPNKTGLWYVGAKSIDDSGNVSSMSSIDTVTIWETIASDFNPADLNPTIYLVHDDDSLTVSGSKTVESLVINGYTFTDDTVDADGKIVQTDSSLYFGYTTGTRRLSNTTGAPFNLSYDKDMSIDAWIYYSGNGKTGTIMAKGLSNDAYWSFSTGLYDDVVSPVYSVSNNAQDTVGLIKLDTGTDSLSVGWHHLAATFDKGVITKLFIDSVVVVTESGTEWSNLALSVINTSDPTVIGQTGLGHLAVLRYYYNIILTPANIKSLYEFGRE